MRPQAHPWKAWCVSFSPKTKRAAFKPPLHAGNMNRVSGHCPCDCHVMSFVSLQYIRVVDIYDLLVTIGDNHRVRAFSQALGHACSMVRVGALGPAHGIAHVPIHGSGLVRRRSRGNHKEQNRNCNATHQHFFHSTPLIAVRPQIFGTKPPFRCAYSHEAGTALCLAIVKGINQNYITT
jgi:hypothetical protein